MESERPLRILAVVNLPWDRKLGAPRVWIELAEQWRAAGHTVDKYCLTDAFPTPSRLSAVGVIRQVLFAYRAKRYIQQNGARYDVIDSLLGTLPFSKKNLHFSGLLVARSVGFYRLYEKFDLLAQSRWPDLPWGKFVGRTLYRLVKHRAHRAAERSVRHADLLNLANDDELAALRQTVRSTKPALVLPYGLSLQRREALTAAAHPADERFATKKICFIGMWTVRKGAKDWAELIRLIRNKVPSVTFLFLGTLTEDKKVLDDLDLSGPCDFVQLVREYEPEALPGLLRDSTIGLFPSYVEGFGFGVLEQLASGIPTIAYDVPGPRQILRPMASVSLTPAGDTAALADHAVNLLQSDLPSYARLREESLAIAARYSWPEIAEKTIRAYHRPFGVSLGAVAFTHPFGLQSPTGGSRIMRALLQKAPERFVSICTSAEPPPETSLGQEVHVPLRPDFGRIERTRFAGMVASVAPLFARRFARKLEKACRQCGATAIHSIAHGGMDFYSAFVVARKLSIPFFLQVHDDFIFSARGIRNVEAAQAALREAWQNAAARFVICRQLGAEYCHRYGEKSYQVITDGVERIADSPKQRAGDELQIYFMGLFHLDYEPNLRLLLAALAQLQDERVAKKLSLVLRCGGVRPRLIKSYEKFVRILPFASEAEVQSDMKQADLLYLPLPFGKKYELFVRFSLSTKMVTYVASGIPILYHGPPDSAVHELLNADNAALLCTEPSADVLAEMLRVYIKDKEMGTQCARNALKLARQSFNLSQIRDNFWGTIDDSLER
jgi:glycosyltransferase involved in cell wall biosynthesis